MHSWRSILRRLLEWTHCIPRTQFRGTITPDHPALPVLSPGVIHVVGDRRYQKWAYLACPCGCNAPIMLSLSKTKHPRWEVQLDWLERPTVQPSVWQTTGCYSHFWIKQGRIEWTADTGRPHVSDRSTRR